MRRYWLLRNRLSPTWRARGRRLWDASSAWAVGSWRATRAPRAVSLTFDDGPAADLTPALLDALDLAGARVTFFVLLSQARTCPQLVRDAVARGHEVGLHGPDHSRLTGLGYRGARRVLRAARAELADLAGAPVRLFRPPYGAQSLASYLAARRAGMQVVVWSRDAADWVDRPASEVAGRALTGLTPGDVLLLHERLEPDPQRGAPTTSFDRVEMTRAVLAGVAGRGWSVAPVGTLAAAHGVRRTAWFRP